MISSLQKISLFESILLILIVLGILGGIMIFVPGATPHFAVFTAIVFLLIYGLIKGVKYTDMQDSMAHSVHTSLNAIYLFFFIGILISSLMMSGAIPSLMYYGFNIMSTNTFYLSCFVLTSIIGVAIGSSLTTVSTIGVALLGISSAFGANPAITAGAIVSGAFFGDKMSPLSDTTTTASSIVGVDLFEHIKNMGRTTVPMFIVSSIVYYLLSLNLDIQNVDNVEAFKSGLISTGLVHIYSLIPFVILIILAIFKVSSIVSMLITSLAGIAISYLHSTPFLATLADYFFSGYSQNNLPENVVRLVSRGGISSMFFTITIIILALSLGGLLFSLGIVSTILNSVESKLNSKFKATLAVALTAVGINYIVGEQYLSILLSGETFKPVYARLNLHPKHLSRTLEDAGTVINPLVPWSVCGVFISSALGVSVLDYIPYAIFCYGCLIFTIISGLFKDY